MKFAYLSFAAVMLTGCTTEVFNPQTAANVPDVTLACGQPVVSSDAWIVEGFGGSEEQVIVSKRTPVKRCSPQVVQTHGATLAAAQ